MSESQKLKSELNTEASSTNDVTSFRDEVAGAEDSALAEMQNEIQDLRNDRNEERFLLVLIIIVLIDAFIFTQMANWAGAIIIGLIEIFGIAVLARRWSIEEVPQMLSKFLDRTADRINPPARDHPQTRPDDPVG